MRILTIGGVPVRLHWSFAALLVILLGRAFVNGGVDQLLVTAFIDAGLVGSVTLHELGHALAARQHGIRTAEILLFPFGGAAMLTSGPRTPRQELEIALAGPAVNLVLAAGFGLLWAIGFGWPLGLLASANGVMGVFNLLPAYPMDGGRVLRALLVPSRGYAGASRAATRIGRGMAWAFVALGVVSGWWTVALTGGVLLMSLNAESAQRGWRGV